MNSGASAGKRPLTPPKKKPDKPGLERPDTKSGTYEKTARPPSETRLPIIAGARRTAIDAVGAVPWGTHLCQFYQTKQDLFDVLVPFIRAGLEDNEFCIWITSEPLSEKEVEQAMSTAVPNFAQYLERGQIEFVPHTEFYFEDGVFNLQRVNDILMDKLDQALARGYDGLRITGNTAWVRKKDRREFTDYEAEINKVIGENRLLSICTYSLDKCGVSEVMDAVGSHQGTLIRRAGNWVFTESSEYRRAEKELRESQDKYRSLFDNMLNGFAYCKIIVDKNNKPIDFVYLEVNDAFERLTGLRKEDIIGRKVTEAIPGTKESHPELFSIYGKAALTGEEAKFEIYFKPLAIWLTISVYSPQNGYFVAVFENITERKRMEEVLRESQEVTSRATSEGYVTPLQERLVKSGFEGLTDTERVRLIFSLCRYSPECDKGVEACIRHFKTVSGLVSASEEELRQVGVCQRGVFIVRLLRELPAEILRSRIIEKPFYKSSEEVFDYLYYSMRDLRKEVLKAIYLDSASHIIDTVDLFEGTLESIPIRPRDIVDSAIRHGTAAIIFVHNHPSGDPLPSKSDKQLTRDLVFVGKIIQIKVLDHMIIGGNRYFSFADEGLIEKYELDFLNYRIRVS